VKLGVALPGPFRSEALAILEHCKDAGMSWQRAYAIACLASMAEGGICWTFQSTVARFTGYSVRTIQRAVRQAKSMGVLVSRRLRRGERPPRARQPITCGGALRRFIAWAKPKAQRLALCAKYALRELWRREALERRKLAETASIREALREFRTLGT
jgi:Helix-turn-helix domain